MQYSQKGFRGMQSSSPASNFLPWDKDAARTPFQAMLRPVIGNYKKELTMRFIVILFIVSSLLLSGCLSSDTKCCDNIGTNEIAKGLYLERYRTFCAGVFGELTECYLTDSITFRQKIGSYDEHEKFDAKLKGETVEVYNFKSSLLSDTIEQKTIIKSQLFQFHHTDKNCKKTMPLFGTNSIKCDADYYPAGSYKTDDGNYISEVQFKCGNDYSNAVFYTDSINFCVFIGIYKPGSFANNYSVKLKNNSDFIFYNITEIPKTDTVKFATFSLNELRKGKLIEVCGLKK